MAASSTGLAGKNYGTRMNGQHGAAAIAPEPRDAGQSHNAATRQPPCGSDAGAGCSDGPSQNDSLAAS